MFLNAQQCGAASAADSLSTDWVSVIADLREENKNLLGELTEARDQADLLEFRILELQEEDDKVRKDSPGQRQVCTSSHNRLGTRLMSCRCNH